MNKAKRVIASLMASLVIMTTTYNVYTVQVNAVAIGGVTVSLVELIAALVATGLAAYVGSEVASMDDYQKDEIIQAIEEFVSTPEGYNALCDVEFISKDGKELSIGQYFGVDHMVHGVGSSGGGPNPEDMVKVAALAVVFCSGLAVIIDAVINGYFDSNPSSGSTLSVALNAAVDQDITVISPFPSFFHISSMDNPKYSLNSIGTFESQFPEFSMDGNYFIQVINPYNYDFVYLCPPAFTLNDGTTCDTYIGLTLAEKDLVYASCYLPRNLPFSTTFYINRFSGGCASSTGHSSRSLYFGDNSDIYVCGNILVLYNGLYYYISSDGAIYESDSGCSLYDLVVTSLSTPEGKLTSVKPIVNTDISALVNAIGKAIVDAYPDVAPVLTPQAIEQIYNNVSNVYDDAVTNYYNDTSYIDQSQYITNITNVFEQAIADNPVIDLPATDTGILSGIKAIPGQIANVLVDVFIPDLSLLQGYINILLGYFSWALEPWNFFQNLINIIFVDNPDPPVIYIDFSKAESSYIYGGKAVVLDMRWYARYKPYADTIIVSFSYLWFAYWLFRNLPEILSGVSPVPVARSAERAAARMDEEIKRADPEYGRVKVDAVGSINPFQKGVHYSGAHSAHHNIQDDQTRPK